MTSQFDATDYLMKKIVEQDALIASMTDKISLLVAAVDKLERTLSPMKMRQILEDFLGPYYTGEVQFKIGSTK